MNKFTIMKATALLACILPIATFSEEMADRREAKKIDIGKDLAGQNSQNGIDYSLKASIYGGGMFGYQSYSVNSPVTGGDLYGAVKFNINSNWYLSLADKFEGENGFEGAQNTTYTLDYLKNFAKAKFGFDNKTLEVSANMSWTWMYRPNWPDLYQPNPLLFGDVADPAFGDYLPTNRNSYHKLEPELSLGYKGVKNLDLALDLSYVSNLEETDPNFDPTVPTHLTPSVYSGFVGDLKTSYEFSKLFALELRYKAEYRAYEIELARDAVTGKTHYSTTPNPKYTEFNNKIQMTPEFNIRSIKMKIRPFIGMDINEDLFQGYYSYTGFEPGIEIEQKIGNFSYSVGVSYAMDAYGANSMDPAKTQDGQALYKNFLKGAVELGYKINKNIDIFINTEMGIKETNYTPYEPGINPASKNYSIDFSYENYYVRSGVSYKL